MLDNNILANYGKIEYWEERYSKYFIHTFNIYFIKFIFHFMNIEDQNLSIGIKYIPE